MERANRKFKAAPSQLLFIPHPQISTARWQEQHQTSPKCHITTQDRSDVLGKVLRAALGAHSVCVSTTENSLQTALSTSKMLFLRETPHCCGAASPRGTGSAAPLGQPREQLPCLSSVCHYRSFPTIFPASIKTRERGKSEMSSL